MKINVDPEFQALIPPLTADEYQALEQSILKDGCRHPLVVWRGILVDGHHRREICERHSIPYKTAELDRIDTRESALLWAIQTQMGRRNLDPYKRIELAQKQAVIVAACGNKKNLRLDSGSALVTNLSRAKRHDLAAVAGVSEGTVAKVKTIQDHAVPEVIELARANAVSIDVAAQVAALPKDEQSALAAEGPDAMKAAAKRQRDRKKNGTVEPIELGVQQRQRALDSTGHVTSKTTNSTRIRAINKKVALLKLINNTRRIEVRNLPADNKALRIENDHLKEQLERLGVAGAHCPQCPLEQGAQKCGV